MDALDALLKNLADEAQPLSLARLYLLSSLEPADVNRVRAVWSSIPAERRQSLMRHLVDISEVNFEVDFGDIFRIGLVDADADVRVAAVDGLWEENDVKLIRPLIDLMHADESEAVRAAAAGSLGRFVLAGELEEISPAKATPAVEALRREIADETIPLEVRRRAVEAIGYSSEDDVPDIVRNAYADDDERMRLSAVFAMGRSADTRWNDVILQEMESANPEMRFEAARASGELQNAAAVPTLSRLLQDEDDQVREAAVWALGQIGGNEPRRLLTEILDDEDAEALHEAAEAALEELEFMSDDLDFALFDFGDRLDDGDDDLPDQDTWKN